MEGSNLAPMDAHGFEVLVEQEIMSRTFVEIDAEAERARGIPGPTAAVSGAHTRAFQTLESQEQGAWCFAHLAPETPWFEPPTHATGALPLVQARAIQFELHNALPLPRDDVELVDILDFKERRRAELMALRENLDQIYQRIVSSADAPHAQMTEFERLTRSLNDLAATIHESTVRAIWGSISFDVVYKSLGAARGSAWAAEQAGQDPIIPAAIAGVGTALYRIRRNYIESPLRRGGPLAYVRSAADEQLIAV
jgi:hypothetical protein